MSGEDESEVGEDENGTGNKGVSIALGVTHVMLEGFGCVSDSTTTDETIRRLRRDYGIPSEVILSLPVKG